MREVPYQNNKNERSTNSILPK